MIRHLRSLLAPTTILGAVLSTHYRLHNRHLLARAAEGCPDEVPAPDDVMALAEAAGVTPEQIEAEEAAIYNDIMAALIRNNVLRRLDEFADSDWDEWERELHPSNGGTA